jgi:tripartite-type tricarboxylate transporter receptor subunit TctC
VRSPDIAQRFATLGYDQYTATPAEFARFIETDRARTAKVVKSAGIKLD